MKTQIKKKNNPGSQIKNEEIGNRIERTRKAELHIQLMSSTNKKKIKIEESRLSTE